jgi:hypothetical protein
MQPTISATVKPSLVFQLFREKLSLPRYYWDM